MKKVVFIGDVHGFNTWKQIVAANEDADTVVFIGDYFDSFQIKTDEQVNNFLDIVEYKRSGGKEVIWLIGNHDHHYFNSVGPTGTSGYQEIGQYMITPVLEANKQHLQMAYRVDNVLCTHAGVSELFMDNTFGKGGWSPNTIAEQLNELWQYKPQAFTFTGWDPTGDNAGQTPIWIRPRSLMQDSQFIKQAKIIQVVGHTHQKQIDIEGKATGGKYYFIDCLPKQYLILQDGKFKLGVL